MPAPQSCHRQEAIASTRRCHGDSSSGVAVGPSDVKVGLLQGVVVGILQLTLQIQRHQGDVFAVLSRRVYWQHLLELTYHEGEFYHFAYFIYYMIHTLGLFHLSSKN